MVVIFDWDGTLHDSLEPIVSAWQKTGEDLGNKLSRERIISSPGGSLEELAVLYGFKQDDIKRAVKLAQQYFFDIVVEGDYLFPDSLNVLDKVSAEHKVALYSNGRLKVINALLEKYGIEKVFDIVITSETAVKPAPDGIHIIMNELGEKRAVMVDDNPVGIEAANKAGIYSIGAAYGITPAKLISANPTVIARTVAEVPVLVSKLIG